MDHFVPNKDIKAAEQVKQMRDFARKTASYPYYDVGRWASSMPCCPRGASSPRATW
jgi:homoaconitase/3-isopropylmalate dehydratase large subunit